MRLTTAQKIERNLKIQSAINIIEKSEQGLSIALLAQYTDISKAYLYQHPLVRKHLPEGKQPLLVDTALSTNDNFNQISKNGYQIQVTVGRKNTASLYLIKHGVRVHRIDFKANGKNTQALTNYIPKARYFTAVDKAMVQAVQWIGQQ